MKISLIFGKNFENSIAIDIDFWFFIDRRSQLIKKYTCQNGVRIVLRKYSYCSFRCNWSMDWNWLRMRTPENNGISHFLEHMFFKGTKTQISEGNSGIL